MRQDSERLLLINELKVGDYFGEISLLTNLRRTATVYSLLQTTVGWIATEDFNNLINENPDLKSPLMRKIDKYNDNFIKFLRTMVKNVNQLRKVSMNSIRAIVYLLKDRSAL